MQAAAEPSAPAWKPSPALHLPACAGQGGFGAGELPATPLRTECPAKVPVPRLNLY